MILKLLKTGTMLLEVFFVSVFIDIALFAVFLFGSNKSPKLWIPLVIVLVLIEFLIFWGGIILTYSTSVQLGFKTRIAGAMVGWIPVVNLIMLWKIIRTCSKEVRFETFVAERDEKRKNAKICQTKYPLLLVHGVFFRDYDHLNYWGRIPKELETNGAVIFYGGHNSASAVKDSGRELEVKIKQVLQETGCEKVNIIAHSKGGLDSRALIAANPSLVASLTTINTPHRGCEFADYFFHKLPEAQKQALAARYNALATKLGDVNPDFIAAVYDLTSTACAKFNEEVKDHPDVMYQSYGSVLRKARSGKFPLNLTYNMVRHFDGENDGLVGIDSFPWGESSTLLRNEVTKRGISHGDVIDLNRENIDGFDVREFYVQLVHNLKERGF